MLWLPAPRDAACSRSPAEEAVRLQEEDDVEVEEEEEAELRGGSGKEEEGAIFGLQNLLQLVVRANRSAIFLLFCYWVICVLTARERKKRERRSGCRRQCAVCSKAQRAVNSPDFSQVRNCSSASSHRRQRLPLTEDRGRAHVPPAAGERPAWASRFCMQRAQTLRYYELTQFVAFKLPDAWIEESELTWRKMNSRFAFMHRGRINLTSIGYKTLVGLESVLASKANG
ncbi:hypothetical protein Efla_001681 [Eimeria flavescens]